MKTLQRTIVIALIVVLALSTAGRALWMEFRAPWDGQVSAAARHCEYLGQAGRPATGWIHWTSVKGASVAAALAINNFADMYEPGEPLEGDYWHFYTPFYDLATLSAVLGWDGGGTDACEVVIADYCPGARVYLPLVIR